MGTVGKLKDEEERGYHKEEGRAILNGTQHQELG